MQGTRERLMSDGSSKINIETSTDLRKETANLGKPLESWEEPMVENDVLNPNRGDLLKKMEKEGQYINHTEDQADKTQETETKTESQANQSSIKEEPKVEQAVPETTVPSSPLTPEPATVPITPVEEITSEPWPPKVPKVEVPKSDITPQTETERAEETIAQSQNELQQRIERSRNSSREPLTEGEIQSIKADFYREKLLEKGDNYKIRREPGVKGEFGRFFAFVSGREKIGLTKNGEIVREKEGDPYSKEIKFKINWMFQHPSQELVDYLKGKFEERIRGDNKIKNLNEEHQGKVGEIKSEKDGQKNIEGKEVEALGVKSEVRPETEEEMPLTPAEKAKQDLESARLEVRTARENYDKALKNYKAYQDAMTDLEGVRTVYDVAVKVKEDADKRGKFDLSLKAKVESLGEDVKKHLSYADKAENEFKATLGKELWDKYQAAIEVEKKEKGALNQNTAKPSLSASDATEPSPKNKTPDWEEKLKNNDLEWIKGELKRADEGKEFNVTHAKGPVVTAFLRNNNVSEDEIANMSPDQAWAKAREIVNAS